MRGTAPGKHLVRLIVEFWSTSLHHPRPCQLESLASLPAQAHYRFCIRSSFAERPTFWRPFSLPPRTAPPLRVFALSLSQLRGLQTALNPGLQIASSGSLSSFLYPSQTASEYRGPTAVRPRSDRRQTAVGPRSDEPLLRPGLSAVCSAIIAGTPDLLEAVDTGGETLAFEKGTMLSCHRQDLDYPSEAQG